MLPNSKKVILQNIEIELSQINQSGFSLHHKFLELKRLLERSCKEITEGESLQFPSLFSRLVFIAQKYAVPQKIERSLQQLRIVGNFLLKDDNNVVSEGQYLYASGSLAAFFTFLLHGASEEELVEQNSFDYQSLSLEKIRIQLLDVDRENNILICQPKDVEETSISVRCNVERANDAFDATIESLWIGAQLNLIDCKVDKDGYYIPSMFVLEPDYLIDASAMAECFQNYGNSHLHYFRRKFEPMASTHYILLGNLANFFLDELIYADDAEILDFNSTFLKSFKQMPFEFTACKDIEGDIAFRDFMQRAKRQFENIKRVVLFDLKESGFLLNKCILEPSFFSEKYGFQGRLDLLQIDSDDSFTRIIELKSGKTPWPQDDVAKIASNHETQTSVYRLMIQSVFEKKARDIHAMILYSSSDFKGQNLRLSAPYKQLEKEIINVRNLIVATEHKLYMGNSKSVDEVFSELFDLDNYAGRVPDFFEGRLAEIKKVLLSSSKLERLYFSRFISFVSRELYLLKMGDEGYESSMSTSALWNTNFEERKKALELVSDLEIENIEEDARDMKILFKRESTSSFVNFREGEICILYPRQSDDDTILSNQILKGTVIEISENHLSVRFRYKQRNRTYFEENKYWVVEHDKLDHSYNGMYKSLFSFMQATKEKKDLLLGLKAPKSLYKGKPSHLPSKEEKRQIVIDKALSAEDYFLIVGPPGTGKTSIFARQLIEQFYKQPDIDILVVAYTNRAVDELCAAICAAFEADGDHCDKYIRIGSEYSCNEAYRGRLLQNISDKAPNRKELLDVLTNTRIYVGTLASVLGKPELFEMKKFDIAIIDEASQILEPQIIGLLPLFKKFIMIGDHKQLSTITLQSELKSLVDIEELNEIGLYDCRESIFERLYRTVQQKGWVNTYETLDYHGRMHEDIAKLVNDNFYEGRLLAATQRQTLPLDFKIQNNSNNLQDLIVSTRAYFIDISSEEDYLMSDKTNEREAEAVVEIAKLLVENYVANNKEFRADTTLGIIAPYRNQIALIKYLLKDSGVVELQNVLVDTVERFQGSQRDVIIVSFCFNRPYQMRYFSNMNREGTVDRKLNVALTRAREQLFLVGNAQILNQNKLYRELLEGIVVKPKQ